MTVMKEAPFGPAFDKRGVCQNNFDTLGQDTWLWLTIGCFFDCRHGPVAEF